MFTVNPTRKLSFKIVQTSRKILLYQSCIPYRVKYLRLIIFAKHSILFDRVLNTPLNFIRVLHLLDIFPTGSIENFEFTPSYYVNCLVTIQNFSSEKNIVVSLRVEFSNFRLSNFYAEKSSRLSCITQAKDKFHHLSAIKINYHFVRS